MSPHTCMCWHVQQQPVALRAQHNKLASHAALFDGVCNLPQEALTHTHAHAQMHSTQAPVCSLTNPHPSSSQAARKADKSALEVPTAALVGGKATRTLGRAALSTCC